MKPRAATSRADLLLFRHKLREIGALAACVGFEWQPPACPSRDMPELIDTRHLIDDARSDEPTSEHPLIEFPEKPPSLEFFAPIRHEILKPLGPPPPRGDPISDVELAVDWTIQPPKARPLVAWSRLAPFVKSRLGATVSGNRLNIRRLLQDAGRGLPIIRLPRLPRQVWASQALVLRDSSAEMLPFAGDVQEVVRRLRRDRGNSGLKVLDLRMPPTKRVIARMPPDVPVLALTCQGRYHRDEEAVAAWEALGKALAHRKQPAAALTPHRLEGSPVPTDWEEQVWDHRCRLPQRFGQRLPKMNSSCGVISLLTLLDLLSPASRVSAALLRDVRLLLGADADVATEWHAWFHEGGWHSLDCFGFEDGDLRNARFARRRQMLTKRPELVRAVDHLIAFHHQDCSPLLSAEAAMRACLSSDRDAVSLSKGAFLLRRVVDRLRMMAADVGSAEGRRSGLAEWFARFVDTLEPKMRSNPAIAEEVARGLALAHVFLESGSLAIPEGVQADVYRKETRASVRPLPRAMSVSVLLAPVRTFHTNLFGFSVGEQNFPPFPQDQLLGHLLMQSPIIHLSAPLARRIEFRDIPSRFFVPTINKACKLSIQTDLEALHYDAMPRPTWASRMGYDRNGLWAESSAPFPFPKAFFRWAEFGNEGRFRWKMESLLSNEMDKTWRFWADEFGLAAEFVIGQIPFVLRWIPPGSFLMGSPEDEPGRQENERPQHRVEISKGFWMGETPVTQAQWEVVVQAAYYDHETGSVHRKRTLKKKPSHFQGSAELPVESVSWEDSRLFCELLDALLPDGPGFRLPTEAQWEFACRGGEPKVPFNGPIRLEGHVLSPDLEAYAWYGGNSGKDCVVSNPQDSSSWLSEGIGSPTAGTHPVKIKFPNGIGLHDMLGNVWEWCADAWDEKAYAKRADGVKDPRMDSADKSALRVVRGGSWFNRAQTCRAAYRDWHRPGARWYFLGLRLAAGQESAEPQGKERSDLPRRRSRARRAGGSNPA